MTPYRTPEGVRLLLRVLTAFLLLAIPGSVSAQHTLVLSGGGARGLSHAGALVAIEELGYRPDLVIGTSMGAIVGALYAAGFTPTEIRDLIENENWLERFAPEPILVGPTRDPRRPLLEFGISRGRFYGGFLASPGINQRLVEMLFDAGVRARNDYDRLPIRYRAVTADLSTGAEFVIGRGDLPRAVRASMAVPGVFAPVQWGERVLIDGGVANNLPVSVARALSDRPVMAIDVLRPAADMRERGSLDLGVRALRLLIENARPDGEPDILVLPDIEPGFSESYFPADARSVLRAGYAAVVEQVSPVAEEPPARRAPGDAPAHIGGLRVEGADAAFERLIRRVMSGAVREYDSADIVRRVSALYMTGLFQSVWPRVEFEDDSTAPTLVINVTPAARTSAAGAARWNNDVGGGAWISLQQRVSLNTPTEFRLAGTIDELRHDAGLDVSMFSALVPGLRWNAGIHAGEQRLRFFDGGDVTDLLAVRRYTARAGGELHGTAGDWYLSLFATGDHASAASLPGQWAIGPVLRIARRPDPDRVVGVDPLLEAEVRGGDIEYHRARVRVGRTVMHRRRQAALFTEVASTGSAAPLDVMPSAYRDIAPWLPAGAMRHPHQAVVGLDAAIPTVLSGYVRLRLRAITAGTDVEEIGRADNWRLGGEIGTAWPTVLGPITFGLAAGQRASWRFNVGVGADF